MLEFDNMNKYKKIKHDLVPVKKLYRKCKGELGKVFDMEMKNRKDPDYVDEESKIDCSVLFLIASLVSLECSPLKAVRKERAERYGKRNYKEAKEKLSSSIGNVLDLTLHDCDDCSVLMQELKEKLQKI